MVIVLLPDTVYRITRVNIVEQCFTVEK